MANVASSATECNFCRKSVTGRQVIACEVCNAVAHLYCVPGYRPSEAAAQRKAFWSLHFKCAICQSLEVEAAPIAPPVPVSKRAAGPVSAPAKRTRVVELATAPSTVSLDMAQVLASVELRELISTMVADAVSAQLRQQVAVPPSNPLTIPFHTPFDDPACPSPRIPDFNPLDNQPNTPAQNPSSTTLVETPIPVVNSTPVINTNNMFNITEFAASEIAHSPNHLDFESPHGGRDLSEPTLEASLPPPPPTEAVWTIKTNTSTANRCLLFDGLGYK